MKMTNLLTQEVLFLPDDLYWTDEFEDVPFEEREERSVTGLLLLFQQDKIGGQPLTLSSSPERNWIQRSKVKTLYKWGRQSGLKLKLEMGLPVDNRVFEVSFRHSDKNAIDAKPIIDAKPLDDAIYYRITLKLRIHSEIL